MVDELGTYKEKIDKYFRESDDICHLLLGDNCELLEDFDDEFDKYVNDALFVPDTVTKVKSYICYEVIPDNSNRTVESFKIQIYALAHKDYIKKYDDLPLELRRRLKGNRADKLAQAIENSLMDKENTMKFGIGSLEKQPGTYFNSEKFYGRIMYFKVPDFR